LTQTLNLDVEGILIVKGWISVMVNAQIEDEIDLNQDKFILEGLICS
jgi:hypothetical protein